MWIPYVDAYMLKIPLPKKKQLRWQLKGAELWGGFMDTDGKDIPEPAEGFQHSSQGQVENV